MADLGSQQGNRWIRISGGSENCKKLGRRTRSGAHDRRQLLETSNARGFVARCSLAVLKEKVLVDIEAALGEVAI
jgi:hypothetical protein